MRSRVIQALVETPDRFFKGKTMYYYDGDTQLSFIMSKDGKSWVCQTEPRPMPSSTMMSHEDIIRAAVDARYDKDYDTFVDEHGEEYWVHPTGYDTAKKLSLAREYDEAIDGRFFTEPKVLTAWSDVSELLNVKSSLELIANVAGIDIDSYYVEFFINHHNLTGIDKTIIDKWGRGRTEASLFIPYPSLAEFVLDLSRGHVEKQATVQNNDRHFAAAKGISNPVVKDWGSYASLDLAKRAGYDTVAQFHDARPAESINRHSSSVNSIVEAILGTGDTGITGDEFLTKPPHKDEVIDHGNGITHEFTNGNEYWYKNGKRHRDGDKPAVVFADGYQRWYKNGQLHRDGDKPAIISSNGSQYWFQHGHLHRDGGKPARIWSDGRAEYWINGKFIK